MNIDENDDRGHDNSFVVFLSRHVEISTWHPPTHLCLILRDCPVKLFLIDTMELKFSMVNFDKIDETSKALSAVA